MSTYAAPIRDMQFVLQELVGFDRVASLPPFEAASPDIVEAVLNEAGRLAADVLDPLNAVGDRTGSTLENGVVRTPPGWKDAYRRHVEGGWNAIPFDPEWGGQGLPFAIGMAVHEMWESANTAFALCPMLNMGTVELLTAHGTPEQQATYLPKLISGEWAGTMNLTEPAAGSDVGALRTRAVRDGDHYRIQGQKIFITYGEHDLTDNIVHMVLARLPDAPPGVRGISLFLVPKFLVNPDGSLGPRNDLRCVSLEHKLGIHASPTCVMAYGDQEGAVGYLIGEENRGIEYMFTMMNNARIGVGIQGIALAERAYQRAVAYARARVQSRRIGRPGGSVPIIEHPDIRRMLLTMRAQTEAARALAYAATVALDLAKHHPDPEERRQQQARVDLLTPVVKAWSTDVGVDIASLGVQVHGGMGYIEETGAAQHYRDARIAPIYEGTNGIQANDLVFRKLARDGGVAARDYLREMRDVHDALADLPGDDIEAVRLALRDGLDALESATDWMLANVQTDPESVAAGASPYLRLFGIVAGGAMMARAAAVAMESLSEPGSDIGFYETKLITARFYAEHILPQARAGLVPITQGFRATLALSEEHF